MKQLALLSAALIVTLALSGCPGKSQEPVRSGSFCSPEGAMAETAAGTSVTCVRESGEEQARWRAR